MITFIASLIILILGYIIYGGFIQKIFGPDDRKTPAMANSDGIDYVPMSTWKVFLIQLLNIAGTGPIFGALMGAVFGPVVFFWIVFGSILGGAVHDFLGGMISERMNGASIVEISGKYMGNTMRWVMRIFSVVLLILVGTVFVTSPAALLARLTPNSLSVAFWIGAILIYYVLATLLPIDKVIGKLYPVFGVTLIIMAVGIIGGLVFKGYELPEMVIANLNPTNLPVWPFMFITVACGAISGFHATQSPMMARCMKSEKNGKVVFYGAMIAEAVIALVWAAAGVAFYGTTGGLSSALASMGQSGVVYDISTGLLGAAGGILAIVGVVACPITSGDTAFRSARLIIAEWLHIDQKQLTKRLWITIPLLGIGTILTQLDFDILWRYFSWSNQTLAMIALWACAAYLCIHAKNKLYSFVAAIPATFMSAVCSTYILMAKEGFRLSAEISYPIGIVFAAICFLLFFFLSYRKTKTPDEMEGDKQTA